MSTIKRIFLKFILVIIYSFIIGILVYSSFMLFSEDRKIVKWKDVEKTNQYTYLEFDQMSEAFAKIGNKQIHFVREKESSGAWRTYLIAIKEEDYSKYKANIDYTYKRTEIVPKTIKAYGYPIEIPSKVKKLAIKNITKFVPIENEIKIDDNNFEKYLTNTYLDTTIEKQEELNYYVIITLLVAFVLFIIIIYTIFEKDNNKNNKKINKKKNKKINKKKKKQKEEEIEII